MAGGYMGKILFIDLSKGQIREEAPAESLYHDFIGGYGVGARLLFSRQKAKVDPLGPGNTLGFLTGPLTGTNAVFGCRFMAVGKSPLTGGWGDANCGGDFGPYLKFAGYDGVFFTGQAAQPVYLLIEDGKAELRSAAHLWGKDSHDTEDLLWQEVGKEARIACIGPAGEKRSLISAIMNAKGRAAGRSGLGAVMGSKNLKAVAAKGNKTVPIANEALLREVRRKHLDEMKGPFYDRFAKYGTTGIGGGHVARGGSPVKNWGSAGLEEFPNAQAIYGDNVSAFVEKRYGCWRCPMACGALMKAGTGKYQYAAGAHRPEYETLAAFGNMCLNEDVEAIIAINDICNRYGLDTISTGGTLSFAIECYENGIVTRETTDGLELRWGNAGAIVKMTEKLAKREGFGDVLADGVKVAAERLGRGAEEFAMHIGGQELPMHDPKMLPGRATTYWLDATPGRHTQGGAHNLEGGRAPEGFDLQPLNPRDPHGKGAAHRVMSSFDHVMQASGMCSFGLFANPRRQSLLESLHAVTGRELTVPEAVTIGERIANIRHAFNIREGINPLERKVPGRMIGQPAMDSGPWKGVTVDIETQAKEALEAMGWDRETAAPKRATLERLGLKDVADALGV
ncbi:MAG: aldehyde ferredoxin oxidoreductase family protein [Chloroflexi bacterium]|nr:aldehyde ferredoxin oxidoreductase family protein [Chloroflexota bacterium]